MTPPIIIHAAGPPAREIVRRGVESVAEIVFCIRPPRLNPPPPQVRGYFRSPIAIPKLSRK